MIEKRLSCGQCGEIERIVRIDTTVASHTEILKDINKKLDKSPNYRNSFFGGMITTAVIIGGMFVQVMQPIIKPIAKIAVALVAK